MSARLLAVAFVLIAAAFSSNVLAQQPGPPPGGGDKNLGSDVMPGVKGRSNEIERVKRDAEKPETKKREGAEESFPQIKEDFEQIQQVNSSVLQAAPSGEAPNYARIHEAASEIKKRATRLKKNLFGAETGEEKHSKEKDEKGAQDLKALLPALDDAIGAFVHSPLFQNAGVVNPDDSAKAARDLEAVIKLSARVEKESERLSKEKGS
jgi:hypothetical protein